MNLMRKGNFILRALAIVLFATATTAFAGENWPPESGLTIRVSQAAGGTMDLVSRIIGQGLQDTYGQTVVITNVTGANGAIAANELLATPDSGREMMAAGLMLFTLAPLFNPEINTNLDDFKIITSFIAEDFVLYVNPKDTGIKSYEELIEYGKSNRILFGSNNPGGTTHLLATGLFGETGIDARAITSPGSARDMLALASGTVACAIATPLAARQFVEEGSALPILVFSEDAYTAYPGIGVPTAKSKGVDIVFRSSNFLATRAGVEQSVVDSMYKDIMAYYETPKFKELADTIQFVPNKEDGETVRKAILAAQETCRTLFDKYYKNK